MMDNYIIKEADKTKAALVAILKQLFQMSSTAAPAEIRDCARNELAERLGLDVDSLLEKENFIPLLVSDYHFDDSDLNKFAELLYTVLRADEGKDDVHNLYAKAISAINKWLDDRGQAFSATRHYVLEENSRYF